MFDEADIDAAIARFEELNQRRHGWKTRQAKWKERIQEFFAARDWDAMAKPGRRLLH